MPIVFLRRSARPPTVEALEDRTVPSAADLLSAVATVDPGRPDEVAVGRLYQGLLNRLPEPAGLAYWTSALSQGATTAQIADAFVHTDEYRRTQVHAAYVELLGRAPDIGGHQVFVDFLAGGGTLTQARALLASSPEYVARNADDYVDALYRDALGRAPTADEVANAGTDPARLAATVFGSAEAWRKQASDAYQRFLSRDADDAGLAYWTDRLVKGSSLQSLAAALAGARESTAPKAPSFEVGTLGGDDFSPQALALGPPLVFQAFPPERWIDTRAAFPPANGDGIMAPGEVRTFDILGVASDQGNFLPAGTVAISATLFVVGSTNPSGHWAAYPADLGAVPNIASIYSDHAGAIIASSIIVPLGTTGANAGKIKVFSGPGGDIVLDINGVFLRDLNAGDQLRITGNTGGQGAIAGRNGSTASNSSGVVGELTSTTQGTNSAAVRGINNGTGTAGLGVWGSHAGNGIGVQGTAGSNGTGGNFSAGVAGGTTGTGVVATGGTIGVNATGTTRGVDATATSTTALVYAVEGTVNTSAGQAAGVRGANSSTTNVAYGVLGEITTTSAGVSSAAVRGDNHGTGTSGIGVWGSQDGSGVGVLGQVFSATGIGVQGNAPAGSSGLHAVGNITATGAKAFVDPHPTDPTKQITYVALEGPEVGTYFRSRGRFDHGMATVIVPDSFRLVTEAEGLSVQVTPIGRLANVAVQSFDLNQIVLLGSEDVEFFVTVNGVRKGYADFNAIQDNTFFRPRDPDNSIWTSLTTEQQRRLVATGIYNADGTVNVATAQRLGWANGWTTTTTTTA